MLYERDCTLSQVLTDLDLPLPDAAAQNKMRRNLGFIMGRWPDPSEGTDAKAMAAELQRLAKKLESLDPLFSALVKAGRHSHKNFQAAILLSRELRPEIENSNQFIEDFHTSARYVAEAAKAAANKLGSLKGKPGRLAHCWYDDFTRFLVSIAEQNGIKATVVIDRETGAPRGRFLELALGFQRLLYPAMRPPNPKALAKRLERSLARIRNDRIV